MLWVIFLRDYLKGELIYLTIFFENPKRETEKYKDLLFLLVSFVLSTISKNSKKKSLKMLNFFDETRKQGGIIYKQLPREKNEMKRISRFFFESISCHNTYNNLLWDTYQTLQKGTSFE
jgi:hypothetical protein